MCFIYQVTDSGELRSKVLEFTDFNSSIHCRKWPWACTDKMVSGYYKVNFLFKTRYTTIQIFQSRFCLLKACIHLRRLTYTAIPFVYQQLRYLPAELWKMETKLHQEDDPIFGAAGRHKPCRACTDFKTWTKNQKEHWNQEKQETEPVRFFSG